MSKSVMNQDGCLKNKRGTYMRLAYPITGSYAGAISASCLKKMKGPTQCAECNAEEKQQCPLLAQESGQ